MGTWVQFDSLIKSGCLRILDEAYNYGLKWAHEPIDNPPDNLE